jgi:hypothetical protein
LLRQFFYNLNSNSLNHGKKLTHIQQYYKKGADEVNLFDQNDGGSIPKNNKQNFQWKLQERGQLWTWITTDKKMTEVYVWSITEESGFGRDAKFEIAPKFNSIRKYNCKFLIHH